MYNSCTIIPTHLPHFEFTLNAVKTYNQTVNGDLYLVFSTQDEYQNFRNRTSEKFNYLILDDAFKCYSNVITAKKFFAIKTLSENYKYMAIFDSEIEFVKSYNESDEYEKIFLSKVFKANISTNGIEIMSTNVHSLGLNDEQTNLINLETQNLDYYWWFNEVCVYESDTFNKFYEWLSAKTNFNQIMSTHHCFDYLLYSIWLILFENFKIQKFEHQFKWGALEDTINLEIINEFKSLVSKNAESEYTKVIIHKDRP
jgi:hypothetical protein